MMCKPNIDEEIYEFFENIVNYIQKAQSAESTSSYINADEKCNSFMVSSRSDFKDRERAKRICVQFIKLYDSLGVHSSKLTSDPNYENCRKFLIYWINFKLRECMQNEDDSVCGVYDDIGSQFTGNRDYNIHMGLIDNINKEDLYKMNILYRLYVNYVKLNAINYENAEEDKRQLLTHSTACCPDYNKAKYMCSSDNKDNNPKFCEKLEAFETKYHDLERKVAEQESDFSYYFIKLSECPNNKIITTAVTGSIIGLIPLFGVLYKFTPMGQVIRSKLGILNNDISNIDEDMTNISLMGQENEHIPFQKGTYNIKYQSV